MNRYGRPLILCILSGFEWTPLMPGLDCDSHDFSRKDLDPGLAFHDQPRIPPARGLISAEHRGYQSAKNSPKSSSLFD